MPAENLFDSPRTTPSARLLYWTLGVDKVYRFFDRSRSALVVSLASDRTLTSYNDLIYGETETYQADSTSFRDHLFPWEEAAIANFFPPPPARILVGGAGGGREPFVLARRGYDVVAFEPSHRLVKGMAASVPTGCRVGVYHAGYEDLPLLGPVRPEDPPTNLGDLGAFDGAILGWSSIAHVRSQEQRTRAVRDFASVTNGPILISFFARSDTEGMGRLGRLRRMLPSRRDWAPGDDFAPYIGYFHRFNRAEVEELARASGVAIRHLNAEGDETIWPHAVLDTRTGMAGSS